MINATIKYSSDGIQQWVQRYDGPINGTEYVSAMALDAQGNVYITGLSQANGTGYDFYDKI